MFGQLSKGGGGYRGVSPIIGFALILGLSVAVIGVLVVVGGQAIADLQQGMEADQAANEMTQFDSKAALVALGRSDSQQIPLSGVGRVSVEPNSGRVSIIRGNDTGEYTIVDASFGAVVQDTGKSEVAYQGGGVWRKRNDRSVMVSPPEFHYRDQTLTFPIIRVQEGSDGSPSGEVLIRKNGTKRIFNKNRLKGGYILVKITSEYHHGWASFFKTRTEGGVTHYPSNQTLLVNLTVPFKESWDASVAVTSSGPNAIQETGGPASLGSPTRMGVTRPSASSLIDDKIATCQAGGCSDLSAALNSLDSGTYYHNGDIDIGTTSYDTTNGTINVVVNGNLKFSGSSDHTITGNNRVIFFVKGDVKLRGTTDVNTGGDSSELLTMVHSTAGNITASSGTPQYTGLIYAPNSDFTIRGTADMSGAVVAESASAKGNAKLTHDPPGIEFEFDAPAQITYIHASVNQLAVTGPGIAPVAGSTTTTVSPTTTSTTTATTTTTSTTTTATSTSTTTTANQPPAASFTANRVGNSPNVDLNATSSNDVDGSIATYQWDVGDDGTIEHTGETVTKANVPKGTTVRLVVTDDDGATDSISKVIG